MIRVLLGSERTGPVSFRIEGEGPAYLALIAVARALGQVQVTARAGSVAATSLQELPFSAEEGTITAGLIPSLQ